METMPGQQGITAGTARICMVLLLAVASRRLLSRDLLLRTFGPRE
jgi:hypothetical protein